MLPLALCTYQREELPEEVQEWEEHLLLSVVVVVRHLPTQDVQHVSHGRLEEGGASGGQVSQPDVRQTVCG